MNPLRPFVYCGVFSGIRGRSNGVKKILPVLIVLCGCANAIFAQEHIIDVIDTPTANSVEFGSFDLSFRLYDRGSILTRLFYGIIMKNLTLGLSFDAENVVGTGDIEPRRPYLYVKLPLYTGNSVWPGISLGFDEQGFGAYDEDEEQYRFRAMGFFLVLTKKGVVPGLNIGAGVNADYSGPDEKIRGFVNTDFMIGPEFMILAEVKEIDEEGAYSNVGAKYLLSPDLNFEFSVLNIGGQGDAERILRVTYKGTF
jgi:hypothetical protein